MLIFRLNHLFRNYDVSVLFGGMIKSKVIKNNIPLEGHTTQHIKQQAK